MVRRRRREVLAAIIVIIIILAGDIAARRPRDKAGQMAGLSHGRHSTGGMVRIQAISASISLSFQVL